MERAIIEPFTRLKSRILRELPSKKLVGDIVISPDEYMLLTDYLKIVHMSISKGLYTISVDPVLAVALVQIGINHYDSNYWSHLAAELNVGAVSNNHRNKLGDTLRKTLRQYQLPHFGPSDLVKTILMHGFVSRHYADDLFNFLFAFYRLDLERDITRYDRTLMNSLMEAMSRNDNTGRTYYLVQHTADAVRANLRGSKIRIRRLLRLIDRCFWEQIVPANSSNRLSQCFITWKEKSAAFSQEYGKYHGGTGSGHGSRSFSSPHFKCDFSGLSFRLHLPTQLIRFENEQDVYWRVINAGNSRKIVVELYQGVTGYKTSEINLSLDPSSLHQAFELELMCGQTRLRRYKIPANTARFFTKSGQGLQSDNLPNGEVYAVTHHDDTLVSEAYVDNERRGDLCLWFFDFEEGDIVRLPDGTYLSVGKQVSEGLLQRGRVTGAYGISEESQIPLYKRPPVVFIRMLPSRATGTLVLVNDNQHRLFDGRTTVVDINDRSGEKGYIINLVDYGCTTDGVYRAIIDVPNDRTIRQWNFTMIRSFGYSFEDAPYIFCPRGSIRFADGLKVRASAFAEQLSGENLFNFQIDPTQDHIDFTATGDSDDILLRIYVPALKWQFDNGPWQIGKPSELWHTEFPQVIRVKYPDDSIVLSLDDSSDDATFEQSMRFTKLKERHLFECDVKRFRSWFGRAVPVRRIYLDLPGNRQEFISVATKSVMATVLIRGDFTKGLLLGDFNILGRAEYFTDILIDGSLVLEKIPIQNGKIEVPLKLRSGRYEAVVYESEGDDTGFGSGVYLPVGRYTNELLNPADLSGRSFKIRFIRTTETGLFTLNLGSDYSVSGLRRPEDSDSATYYGRMSVTGLDSRASSSFSVRVDFPDLERLNQAYIALQDGDEYIEFLYDYKRRALVKDEDSTLHRAERYRRYTPLYDEYVFIVDFVEAGQRAHQVAGFA